jgi:hypothetical protein
MLDWEWFGDSKAVHVFTFCILSANWKPKRWKGIEIPRGSFFTSSTKLADALNISRQNVRTVLANLKSTNDLTIKSTKSGLLVTVSNYDTYQTDFEEVNQQPTNDPTTAQPPLNQQLTTTKEGKKEEGENKTFTVAPTRKRSKPEDPLRWNLETGWEGVSAADRGEWVAAFPACNIDTQLAAATVWLKANPAKAKKSQWRRFISNWLSRSQERGGDAGRAQISPNLAHRAEKAAREYPQYIEPKILKIGML